MSTSPEEREAAHWQWVYDLGDESERLLRRIAVALERIVDVLQVQAIDQTTEPVPGWQPDGTYRAMAGDPVPDYCRASHLSNGRVVRCLLPAGHPSTIPHEAAVVDAEGDRAEVIHW